MSVLLKKEMANGNGKGNERLSEGNNKKRTQKHRRNRNQQYSNLRTISRGGDGGGRAGGGGDGGSGEGGERYEFPACSETRDMNVSRGGGIAGEGV